MEEKNIAVGIPCYAALPHLSYSLNSLMLQLNASELTIILSFDNDPTEVATREWVETIYKPYFKSIIYISGAERLGPGGNRNRILEWVYSHPIDYIAFMDQDDSLWSISTIKNLYEALFDDQGEQLYPAANGTLLEECTAGLIEIGNHHQTWVHGKIFDVAFLKKWDIWFPETTNEDLGFSNLVTMYCNDKQAYVPDAVYCWRNNRSSLSRSDSYYFRESFMGFVETKCWCYEHIEKHMNADCARAYAMASLPHIYYLSFSFDEKLPKEYHEKAKFHIAKFVFFCGAEQALESNDTWHKLLYTNINSDEAKNLAYGNAITQSYEDWIKYYSHYQPFLEAIKPNV